MTERTATKSARHVHRRTSGGVENPQSRLHTTAEVTIPRREKGEILRDRGDVFMEKVTRRYRTDLLKLVTKLVAGDKHRAEDIVQETLVRAWRSHSQLRASGGDNLLPWLATVARRLAIDEYRARTARPPERLSEPAAMENTRDINRTYPDPIENADTRVMVREAMKSASPDHQAMLIEVYFHGKTVADAAASFGLPLGTAKSRVYYGLREVRAPLEGTDTSKVDSTKKAKIAWFNLGTAAQGLLRDIFLHRESFHELARKYRTSPYEIRDRLQIVRQMLAQAGLNIRDIAPYMCA